MMNKKLTLAVCAVMLLLSACNQAIGNVEETGTGAAADTTAAITEDRSGVDDIPADADLGGMEFRILTRTSLPWLNSMFDVTETNGDPINDTIYNRNRAVENRLNTVIFEEAYDDVDSRIDQVVLSGEDVYDMCAVTDRTAYARIAEGYMYDATELPYIDLSKNYWHHSINDALSIGGKYYLFSGDYNLTTFDYTHVLLFNKQLWRELDLPDIYEAVCSGTWTYDMFREVTAAAEFDLNGDGKMDAGDRYGFGAENSKVLPCFWVAAGETSMTKDQNGLLKYSFPGNTRFVEIFNAAMDVTKDNGSSMYGIDYDEFQNGTMFKNNQYLLYDCTIGRIPIMRDMEVDFGIIPYPKYTEQQQQYYANNDGGKFAFVPATHTAPADASMVIEALASTSGDVYEVYHEKSLKGKSARDEESLIMLQMIDSGSVLDIGRTMWQELLEGTISNQLFVNNDRNISSMLASHEKEILGEIAKINAIGE